MSALLCSSKGRTAALSGEGRNGETLQCVRHGQWLVPESPPNSLSEAKYGVRKRKAWTIGTKLSGLLVAADSTAAAWKFFVVFLSWGPDGGGGSLHGEVSRSAQPHAKPNGPWRPRQLQCHLLLQLHRFPATGNGDM